MKTQEVTWLTEEQRSAIRTAKMEFNPFDDGVSYSRLIQFLACRKKAQLVQIDKKSVPSDSFALTFGSLLHEAMSKIYFQYGLEPENPPVIDVTKTANEAEDEIRKNKKMPGENFLDYLEKAAGFTNALLPPYLDFWDTDRQYGWINDLNETLIKVDRPLPYDLDKHAPMKSGGMNFPLLLKMDQVFRFDGKIWLFDTKTSSRFNPQQLMAYLPHGLQHNMYLYGLTKLFDPDEIGGVIYNYVRTPALRQTKKETMANFIKRIEEDAMTRQSFYFNRLEIQFNKMLFESAMKNLDKILIDYAEWWCATKVDRCNSMNYKNTNECMGKYSDCEFIEECDRSGDKGIKWL